MQEIIRNKSNDAIRISVIAKFENPVGYLYILKVLMMIHDIKMLEHIHLFRLVSKRLASDSPRFHTLEKSGRRFEFRSQQTHK